MATPEQYERQARAARGKAAYLRELEGAIRRASSPLDAAFDDLLGRHGEHIWSSEAASRSRHGVRVERVRTIEAKRLCDALAARLRSAAADQDYVARRSAGEAEAARRRERGEQAE